MRQIIRNNNAIEVYDGDSFIDAIEEEKVKSVRDRLLESDDKEAFELLDSLFAPWHN